MGMRSETRATEGRSRGRLDLSLMKNHPIQLPINCRST